jgi:short-subunit dehydrogenase
MEGYKKVAVVGASGLLGKPLVKQLAKSGFDLILLSRDSTKLRDAFRDVSGVKFKEVEPSDEDGLVEALTGRCTMQW